MSSREEPVKGWEKDFTIQSSARKLAKDKFYDFFVDDFGGLLYRKKSDIDELVGVLIDAVVQEVAERISNV